MRRVKRISQRSCQWCCPYSQIEKQCADCRHCKLLETGVNSTYQLSLDALKEVKTKAELEALMAKLDQQTLERSSQFIMSGYAVDGSGNDVFNIPGSESGGIASFECTLKLERLDAKVEFIVKTEVPADKNWTSSTSAPKAGGW